MMLFPVFNYVDGNHDVLYEQMMDPAAVLGLDDGGAHCGTICDASIPTYVLTHWVRDRARGPRIELEDAVRRLTSQPADLYGFTDRGGSRRDCGPTSTSSTSTRCSCTRPSRSTTCRPAVPASCRPSRGTARRSSPVRSPGGTVSTPAPGRDACCAPDRPAPAPGAC